MKCKLFNNWRIVALCVISWVIYFLIIDSEIIQLFSEKVERVNSNNGLGLLIFMYLGQFFFLLFGIISLLYIAYLIFKRKL